MSTSDDSRWMRRAIEVGAHGGKAVRPNPRVGCVLVRGGEEIASGYHDMCGGPHAEAIAVEIAGEAARGATAYVTLEPCNHWGRTPPCAGALIQAGVARVVIGVVDPHALASGGAAALRVAGVEVELGVEAQAARELAEVFLTMTLENRAFVQCKLASSLDGRTAAADGTSRWLTSPEARQLVHRWRAQADAVLVGSGTAVTDDPRLDVRDLPELHALGLPLRIVLDRRLRLPATSHMADTTQQPTLVVCDDPEAAMGPAADALRRRGVEISCIPAQNDASWLRAVLRSLKERGLCHVLCEGGATLAGSLVREGLCDRLDVLLAPKLLGGGWPLLGDIGVATLGDAPHYRFAAPQAVGADVWLTARPLREKL